MGVAFKPLKNREALRYFKTKVPITSDAAQALADDAKGRAFWVSGVSKEEIAAGLHSALLQNMDTGGTFQDFKKAAKGIAEKTGWGGLSPYRLDNVYRTNVLGAYQAGRFQQMSDPSVLAMRPYWQYSAVMDDRTRPVHRALNGTVARYDDAFWKGYYPHLGSAGNWYRCRCKVKTLSDRQVGQRGLEVKTEREIVNRPYELQDGQVVNVLAAPPSGGSIGGFWDSVADSVSKRAAETASFPPLAAPHPDLPAMPDKGPEIQLLSPAATPKEARAAAGIEAGAKVLAGADGGPVLLAPALLSKNGVEKAYLPNLATVLTNPDEVWLSPYGSGKSGVILRRHYLKIWGGGDSRVVLVATAERGAIVSLQGVTPEHAAQYRRGKRLI